MGRQKRIKKVQIFTNARTSFVAQEKSIFYRTSFSLALQVLLKQNLSMYLKLEAQVKLINGIKSSDYLPTHVQVLLAQNLRRR